MSIGLDDLIVGGQLRVGTGLCPPIKEGDIKINGSAHMEGPVVIGDGIKIPLGEAFSEEDAEGDTTPAGLAPANVMLTRCYNADEDSSSADIKRTVHAEGNIIVNGDDGTPWAFNLNGNQEIVGNTQTNSALKITSFSTFGCSILGGARPLDINGGTVWVDAQGEAYFAVGTGGMTMSSRFGQADGKPKPFDIQHPTKGKGHRLRYACIEGPEVGVYHRGRLRRGKEIVLPYYWKDLVHVESITVQLQPVGAHQDIIVKRWDEQKIYLQSNGGLPIDCFYHVYGERKDINPLITEYQGDSWKDYPDPNYNPDKVKYEDQTFTDPAFSGPPNTITM